MVTDGRWTLRVVAAADLPQPRLAEAREAAHAPDSAQGLGMC